jgi:fatty acid desaturase
MRVGFLVIGFYGLDTEVIVMIMIYPSFFFLYKHKENHHHDTTTEKQKTGERNIIEQITFSLGKGQSPF